MTKYVALLRGIGPGNPNMRNEKLRQVIEELGMKNVQSVISSGNIIFESAETDISQLEATLEAAWPRELGFRSTTIIRSQQQINNLLKSNPFAGHTDTLDSRFQVTFTKQPSRQHIQLPYRDNKWFEVLSYKNKAVFSTYNSTSQKASALMLWLEKNYGKEITSRTWQTVQRIAQRFDR